MKIIGFFDSLVYLILYGGSGGNTPAAEIILRLRPGVLTEVG
jgi:hypothetical protein